MVAVVEGLKKEPWQNEFDDKDLQNQKVGYNQALDQVLQAITNQKEA